MTGSFLAAWHAQVSLAADTVHRLVARATDDRPIRLEQVVNGYDNEVYRADLRSGATAFVRVGRRQGELFDGETWAMDRARDAGVPVPRVLLETTVVDGDGQRPAMVVEGARGEELAAVLPLLPAADRAVVLTDLGRVLRTLHSVQTPGVWRPDRAGTWPDADELHRTFVADRVAERPHLVSAGLSPAEVEQTLALLGTSAHTPPVTGFVLCHGDATPDHIFIDTDRRVSSLIDWGMWHGGSPVGELGYVASWAHTETDLDALCTGYGAPLDRSLREALARSLVNTLVGQVAHHVTIGDAEGTANVTRSLRRALASLT